MDVKVREITPQRLKQGLGRQSLVGVNFNLPSLEEKIF